MGLNFIDFILSKMDSTSYPWSHSQYVQSELGVVNKSHLNNECNLKANFYISLDGSTNRKYSSAHNSKSDIFLNNRSTGCDIDISLLENIFQSLLSSNLGNEAKC